MDKTAQRRSGSRVLVWRVCAVTRARTNHPHPARFSDGKKCTIESVPCKKLREDDDIWAQTEWCAVVESPLSSRRCPVAVVQSPTIQLFFPASLLLRVVWDPRHRGYRTS